MSYFKKRELFKMYINANHLLRARGYIVTNDNDDYKSFNTKFFSKFGTVIHAINDDKSVILFITKNKTSFTKDIFKNILNGFPAGVTKSTVSSIIIAVNVTIGSSIIKKEKLYPKLTFINSKHLFVNKMAHDYVYQHRVITDYPDNLEKNNFNTILVSDAMCVWLGAKIGDVVEIIRKNNAVKIDMKNFVNMKIPPIQKVYRLVKKRWIKENLIKV